MNRYGFTLAIALLAGASAALANDAAANEQWIGQGVQEPVRRYGAVYAWQLDSDIPVDPVARPTGLRGPFGGWDFSYGGYAGPWYGPRGPWAYGFSPYARGPWLGYGHYWPRYGLGYPHFNPGVASAPYTDINWPYLGADERWEAATRGLPVTGTQFYDHADYSGSFYW